MKNRLNIAKDFLRKISKDGKGFIRIMYDNYIDDYNKDAYVTPLEGSAYADMCNQLDKILKQYKPKKVKDYTYVRMSPGFNLTTIKEELNKAEIRKDGLRVVKKQAGNLLFDKKGNLVAYEATKKHEVTVWIIENIGLETMFKIIDDVKKYEDGINKHPGMLFGVGKAAFFLESPEFITPALDQSCTEEQKDMFDRDLKKAGFFDVK